MSGFSLGSLHLTEDYQSCIRACEQGLEFGGVDFSAYEHDLEGCKREFCDITYELFRPYTQHNCVIIKTVERLFFQASVVSLLFQRHVSAGASLFTSVLTRGLYYTYCSEGLSKPDLFWKEAFQEGARDLLQVVSTLGYNYLSKAIREQNLKKSMHLSRAEAELATYEKQVEQPLIDLKTVTGGTRRERLRNRKSAVEHNRQVMQSQAVGEPLLAKQSSGVNSLRQTTNALKKYQRFLRPSWAVLNGLPVTITMAQLYAEYERPAQSLAQLAHRLKIPYGFTVAPHTTIEAVEKQIDQLIHCNVQIFHDQLQEPLDQFLEIFSLKSVKVRPKELEKVLFALTNIRDDLIEVPENLNIADCTEAREGAKGSNTSSDLLKLAIRLIHETRFMNQRKLRKLVQKLKSYGTQFTVQKTALCNKVIKVLKSPKMSKMLKNNLTAGQMLQAMPSLNKLYRIIKKNQIKSEQNPFSFD